MTGSRAAALAGLALLAAYLLRAAPHVALGAPQGADTAALANAGLALLPGGAAAGGAALDYALSWPGASSVAAYLEYYTGAVHLAAPLLDASLAIATYAIARRALSPAGAAAAAALAALAPASVVFGVQASKEAVARPAAAALLLAGLTGTGAPLAPLLAAAAALTHALTAALLAAVLAGYQAALALHRAAKPLQPPPPRAPGAAAALLAAGLAAHYAAAGPPLPDAARLAGPAALALHAAAAGALALLAHLLLLYSPTRRPAAAAALAAASAGAVLALARGLPGLAPRPSWEVPLIAAPYLAALAAAAWLGPPGGWAGVAGAWLAASGMAGFLALASAPPEGPPAAPRAAVLAVLGAGLWLASRAPRAALLAAALAAASAGAWVAAASTGHPGPLTANMVYYPEERALASLASSSGVPVWGDYRVQSLLGGSAPVEWAGSKPCRGLAVVSWEHVEYGGRGLGGELIVPPSWYRALLDSGSVAYSSQRAWGVWCGGVQTGG